MHSEDIAIIVWYNIFSASSLMSGSFHFAKEEQWS